MVKTGGNQRQYFPGQEDPPIGHWRFSGAEPKRPGHCALRDDRIGRKPGLQQV
jgi:hypothetical protein